MRFTASEKQEIIKLVEQSDIGVNRSLKQLGIAKSTFYKWYKLYTEKGLIGLEPLPSHNRRQWNCLSPLNDWTVFKNQFRTLNLGNYEYKT